MHPPRQSWRISLLASIIIASAAGAGLALRRRRPVIRPSLIVRSADGMLHYCQISSKTNKLGVVGSFPSSGTGKDNWVFHALWLSPDQRYVLVRETEDTGDAADVRLTLYTPAGKNLFSRTDNARPTGTWTSEQPPVPGWLAQVQTGLDDLWESEGKKGARPIASYRFNDVGYGPTLTFGGWLTDAFVIDGQGETDLLIDDDANGFGEPSPWRAVAGLQNVTWKLTHLGPGKAPPPGVAPLPVPPLSKPVTLAAGIIKVAGVAQQPPEFVSGVTHFAGPYLG